MPTLYIPSLCFSYGGSYAILRCQMYTGYMGILMKVLIKPGAFAPAVTDIEEEAGGSGNIDDDLVPKATAVLREFGSHDDAGPN